jgi:hypothetical protein
MGILACKLSFLHALYNSGKSFFTVRCRAVENFMLLNILRLRDILATHFCWWLLLLK